MGNREQGIRDINCFWDIAVFWINVSLKKKESVLIRYMAKCEEDRFGNLTRYNGKRK